MPIVVGHDPSMADGFGQAAYEGGIVSQYDQDRQFALQQQQLQNQSQQADRDNRLKLLSLYQQNDQEQRRLAAQLYSQQLGYQHPRRGRRYQLARSEAAFLQVRRRQRWNCR